MDKKIIYNGKIITMNESQPYAEAVAVKGEKIIAVGNFDEIRSKLKNEYSLKNLNGKTLLPGFIDCHIHAISTLIFLLFPNFSEIKSLKELRESLKNIVKDKDPDKLIPAFNLDEQKFDNPVFPTRWDIDQATQNVPVFIFRHDVHSGVANSRTLELLGITKDTKPPEGGEIEKNDQGEITGILQEQATNMIMSILSLPDSETIKETAIKFFKDLAAEGITSIHGLIEMDRKGGVSNLGGIAIPILKTIQENILQNYYSIVYTANPKKLKRIKKLPLDEGKIDGKFKVGGIKAWMDGTLTTSSAYMNDSFQNQPENYGYCVISEDELYERMKTAHNLGYQIAIHAIGDKANRDVMNLYKKLLTEYPRKDHRHRIEHASLLTKDVLEDMNDYGIIASCQPNFIYSDYEIAKKNLGDDRCKYLYPFKSIIDAGVVLASGSDCPVEDPSPIVGLHYLVNRYKNNLKECLTVEEALKTYTINAAYAAFEENIKGSIEAGKLADLVILDQNPLEVSREKIKDIQVLETIIRGIKVYTK